MKFSVSLQKSGINSGVLFTCCHSSKFKCYQSNRRGRKHYINCQFSFIFQFSMEENTKHRVKSKEKKLLEEQLANSRQLIEFIFSILYLERPNIFGAVYVTLSCVLWYDEFLLTDFEVSLPFAVIHDNSLLPCRISIYFLLRNI